MQNIKELETKYITQEQIKNYQNKQEFQSLSDQLEIIKQNPKISQAYDSASEKLSE